MFNFDSSSLVDGGDNVGHCHCLAVIHAARKGADCTIETGLEAMEELVGRLVLPLQQDIFAKIGDKGGQVGETALHVQQLKLGLLTAFVKV